MMQHGLFDCAIRFDQLDAAGDPLVTLKTAIDWEAFRDDIEAARERYYTYETQLLMRSGNSKVAVSIHDLLADQSSFVHRTVSVGNTGAGSG